VPSGQTGSSEISLSRSWNTVFYEVLPSQRFRCFCLDGRIEEVNSPEECRNICGSEYGVCIVPGGEEPRYAGGHCVVWDGGRYDCGFFDNPYPNGQHFGVDQLTFLRGTTGTGCAISGSQTATGTSRVRLVWKGNGLPPAKVRVYGVVAAEASAFAGPPGTECGAPYGSVTARASATVEGASRAHSCSWSAGEDNPECSPPVGAVRLIEREFDVQFDGREYFVDIPYQFTVNTSVVVSPTGRDVPFPICGESEPWGNGSGEATATAARLLDVFTAGDVVYLLAYTNLVDGAGAFCDPDFCFIQPATGQVATPAGFAAVDFPHTGYVIRSNPAHPSGQEYFSSVDLTYGLETIRIVFDAAQEDGDIRLRQMWRATGVVPVWQTFGDRRFLDTVEQGQYERHEGVPKHREVTVYDANGIALRFWGERQPDGSWRYSGLQGVFSRLFENPDRPGEFYLLGGSPGAMREQGSWLYIFDVVSPVDDRFSGRGAYLKLLVDPAGNKVWVDHSRNDATTYLAYQPTDRSLPLKKMARESGTLK